jgi:hypothetical protein
MFSAGGPTERVKDAMPARKVQKNARIRTIGMSLRSTRPGPPQRRKREAAEVVSCFAEDAEPSRRRLQRAPELWPRGDSP